MKGANQIRLDNNSGSSISIVVLVVLKFSPNYKETNQSIFFFFLPFLSGLRPKLFSINQPTFHDLLNHSEARKHKEGILFSKKVEEEDMYTVVLHRLNCLS